MQALDRTVFADTAEPRRPLPRAGGTFLRDLRPSLSLTVQGASGSSSVLVKGSRQHQPVIRVEAQEMAT